MARTPLHRLIITKGLPAYDTHSQTSLSVMIAPEEPSISLRSYFANNSKFGEVGSFSEIFRIINQVNF
ncbi:hypothetical protein GYB29_08980 [bacterium]|nr:hypothetical protein [bacterium]